MAVTVMVEVVIVTVIVVMITVVFLVLSFESFVFLLRSFWGPASTYCFNRFGGSVGCFNHFGASRGRSGSCIVVHSLLEFRDVVDRVSRSWLSIALHGGLVRGTRGTPAATMNQGGG